MNDIAVLATGGTIDKIHDPITETLVFDTKSHIPNILSLYKMQDVGYSVLMLKDSLDITDADRAAIVDAVKSERADKIVITHGTSTMAKTAKAIQDQAIPKTVVLTGAMRPFSLFQSDAEFNLGCAITAARLKPHGTYIAMNGQIFDAGHVAKNKNTGVFEPL